MLALIKNILVVGMISITAGATAADFTLGTPDAGRYTTGWLKLSDRPRPTNVLRISYDLGTGCNLTIENPVFLSDGVGVSEAQIQIGGNIAVSGNVQYLSFVYVNNGGGASCQIHVTSDSTGEPSMTWNAKKSAELVKIVRGDCLPLSTWMNLIKIQGLGDYTAIDFQTKTLLKELEQLENVIDDKSSKGAAQAQFVFSKQAFIEFRKVFLPLHEKHAKPQTVDRSWIRFQKSFFELESVLRGTN